MRRVARARVPDSPDSVVDPAVEVEKELPMSFGIYAIGFVIMLAGVIYGAYLMHIPTHWIAVGALVLLGAGILSGVKATRRRDSSE